MSKVPSPSGWIWVNSTWPLASCGSAIQWLPGLAVAQSYALGIYRAEGRVMDYNGHRRVSRVRIDLDGLDYVRSGRELKETGTDCGKVAFADAVDVTSLADHIDERELQSKVIELVQDSCGVATL